MSVVVPAVAAEPATSSEDQPTKLGLNQQLASSVPTCRVRKQ